MLFVFRPVPGPEHVGRSRKEHTTVQNCTRQLVAWQSRPIRKVSRKIEKALEVARTRKLDVAEEKEPQNPIASSSPVACMARFSPPFRFQTTHVPCLAHRLHKKAAWAFQCLHRVTMPTIPTITGQSFYDNGLVLRSCRSCRSGCKYVVCGRTPNDGAT